MGGGGAEVLDASLSVNAPSPFCSNLFELSPEDPMHIELIAIGDELLDGRTRDANFHYLGGKLRERGSTLERVIVVADEPDHLVRLFKEAAQRADLIITSGGLGPTRDDRTRGAVARAAERDLEFHPEILERIQNYFDMREMEMPEINRRQAMIPKEATIYRNPNGTADAFEVDIDGTPLIALPGVPFEFRYLVQELILPRLAEDTPRAFKEFHVFGRGESELALIVEGLELPKDVKVTWRPNFPVLTVELSVNPGSEALLDKAYADILDQIAPWTYLSSQQSAAAPLADILLENGWTLATAESCTGGRIASKLTDIPGAAGWFKRGYVTYSNDAKRTDLGVPANALKEHGAVSRQVAEAMAQGTRSIAQTTIAVSVTGIAGPTGGSEEKPVGRVFICAATQNQTVTLEVQAPKTTRKGFKKYVTEFAMLITLRTLQNRAHELKPFRGVRALYITQEPA